MSTPTSPATNVTTANTDNSPPPPGGDGYPEQRHAGQVGIGPNYNPKPSLDEKIAGLKEELKGKVTHNPDKVRHGHDLFTGDEKRRKMNGDDGPNPFAKAEEEHHQGEATADKTQSQSPASGTQHQAGQQSNIGGPPGPGFHAPSEKHAKEQAATVAPEGTKDAHIQRQGGAVDQMKHFDSTQKSDIPSPQHIQ